MKREWQCPVCAQRSEIDMGDYISCTVRCRDCDSSIGLSAWSDDVSVVYTDIPECCWLANKKETN